MTSALPALTVLGGCFMSCGPSKLSQVQKTMPSASIQLTRENNFPDLEFRKARRDTIRVVDAEGKNELILMKAIKDEESGEMVANEVIDAAVVTARFRNVAERRGKIDLQFQIIVPAQMQDDNWQTRFYPDMLIMEDSLRLESIYMTGSNYRERQVRGYEQYERFLSRIITDPERLVDRRQLERFLQRSLPGIYAFKDDMSVVSDDEFYSHYGVNEKMAVEHFTRKGLSRRNRRLLSKRRDMYMKYVKSPIVTDGVRLDTIVRGENGEFIYNYTQTITTRPKLRKVDIILSGDIYEEDRRVYSMPRTEPLTFYVSSISSFVDVSEHYLSRVLERRAEANASYKISFGQGRSDIRLDLSDNERQVGFVKENLTDLLMNEVYSLDSIVVVANSSPEGSFSLNQSLSKRRSESVVRYFESFVRDFRRQIEREAAAFMVDADGRISREMIHFPDIRFISRSVPENWDMLDYLVQKDRRMTMSQKDRYFEHSVIVDKDRREQSMKGDDYYRYVVDSLYPRLRVVDFSFALHRRGMVKDTLHTTELDENYMAGVQLLKDMEYEKAIKILGPYQDYNSAVAYMGAERNASAMLILENLERTPQVNYLLAVLYSRSGREEEAVQSYLDACRKDRSYVYRGNLDPEISQLVKLYGLNQYDNFEVN